MHPVRGAILRDVNKRKFKMAWKSVVRSLEREARRRQRELERQKKELARMQELERAKFEVDEYENYIDIIKSIHKDCGGEWNWQEISTSNPPEQPQLQRKNELEAQKAFDNYVPSFFDKLFKRVEKKKVTLSEKIKKAREIDEIEFKKAQEEYQQNYKEWKEITEIARKICERDINAYLEVIKKVNPFEEIKQIGSCVEFRVISKDLIVSTLLVHDEKVIPKEEKSLLKSGKLSIKPMPPTRFYELYQDYVCGCVLRIARELFALLPIEMVIVNAISNMINKKTGHMEEMPILSVAIPRKTLEVLNFDAIDPSDSMKNFVHRMKFKRGQGFEPVESLNPYDFLN